MFYWTIGRREVVLTDAEEEALMHRAGFTAQERIDFFIVVGGKRSLLQSRLGRFLEEYAARDPKGFELEFVVRSGTGPEHLSELRALVDSYARSVGRLKWGESPLPDWTSALGPPMWLNGRPDALSLAIMHPVRRWFRTCWEAVGQICLPSAEIERFHGNGSSLFIATSRLMIRAGEDYVQVIQVPDDDTDQPWHPESSSA